jgi:hypothetical protein
LRLLVRVFVRFGGQMPLNGLLGACLLFLNGNKDNFIWGNAAFGRLVLPSCDRFLWRVDFKPINERLKHASVP